MKHPENRHANANKRSNMRSSSSQLVDSTMFNSTPRPLHLSRSSTHGSPSRERRRQAWVGLYQELAKWVVVVRPILHVPHHVLHVLRVLRTRRVEAAVRLSTSPPRRIEQERAVGRARRRVLQPLQPFGRARVGAGIPAVEPAVVDKPFWLEPEHQPFLLFVLDALAQPLVHLEVPRVVSHGLPPLGLSRGEDPRPLRPEEEEGGRQAGIRRELGPRPAEQGAQRDEDGAPF
mmetsp:Transcript_32486/g.80558  ORF Transcript_32486/g.80558 Transcript_32486/m.80558 type:complete len:232 (+) Transcript_32486:211-906(+)